MTARIDVNDSPQTQVAQGDCLFVINGLGMGNSTRCHAIMEHLIDRGVRIHILTSGNGLQYFSGVKGIASLTPMESFFYAGKNGGVSGWRTVTSLHALAGRAKLKRRQLEALLGRQSVDVAVTDSEYITSPLRRRRIPVIALNNSDAVVSGYFACRKPPREVQSHFWFVEYADYLFHRFFCDWVLSPSAVPDAPRHPRIRRVGLIVRKAITEAAGSTPGVRVSPDRMRQVVFLLSGSIFASRIDFGDGRLPFAVDVIGREGVNVGSVTYRGRLMDNVALLKQADAMVINGGFSAVSEAMALGKPAFVIPVPGHAEQFVNASVVEQMGYGYRVTEDEVVPLLRKLCAAGRWEGLRERQPITGANGAAEAAAFIAAAVAEARAQRA